MTPPLATPTPSRQSTINRLSAVDLRDLSEAEHAALRQGAINANLSLPDYLGKLVSDASRRLLASSLPPAPADTSLNVSPVPTAEGQP